MAVKIFFLEKQTSAAASFLKINLYFLEKREKVYMVESEKQKKRKSTGFFLYFLLLLPLSFGIPMDVAGGECAWAAFHSNEASLVLYTIVKELMGI